MQAERLYELRLLAEPCTAIRWRSEHLQRMLSARWRRRRLIVLRDCSALADRAPRRRWRRRRRDGRRAPTRRRRHGAGVARGHDSGGHATAGRARHGRRLRHQPRRSSRSRAHLARPIVVHGQTVLAAGTRVSGVVTDATRSGKVKGRAHVARALRLARRRAATTSATRSGRRRSGARRRRRRRRTRSKIGAPAAGGAIIGALVGGKKGAAIGTAVGGGAGTAVVLSTRGKEVHLPKGAALTLRLVGAGDDPSQRLVARRLRG